MLGTTNLLVGPAAGSNSVVLGVTPQTGTWTASANNSWLHLSAQFQSGAGSTNVVFNFDANAGVTRSGTLTIEGQTLTVTQAGSPYIAAPAPPTTLTTTLTTIGVWGPFGVAVDGTGSVYYVCPSAYGVFEYSPANNNVTALASSESIGGPRGVAVDGAGNVYIADYIDNAIKEWTAADSGNLTTLVSSGLNHPSCVAVDCAGKVYIGDDFNPTAIKEWMASNSNVVNLIPGVAHPFGVAVDGSGNVYIGETGNNAVKKWTAANDTVTTLASSASMFPYQVAVDGFGNVYIADYGDSTIKEIPYAFVDPTPKSYNCAAGGDTFVVLPSTVNLRVPFKPTITPPAAESWLTINDVTNGVVNFTFATNSGPNRGASITLLSQTNPIFQASQPNFLNTASPPNGVFQFAFSNFQNSTFTVLSSTNMLLPVTNWAAIGTASNIGPNFFQYTDTNAPTDSQRFYRIRSP